MNENKSTLFASNRAHNRHSILDIIKVKSDNFPMVYLRIPLSHNKLKTRDFGPLIDKINKKLSHMEQ